MSSPPSVILEFYPPKGQKEQQVLSAQNCQIQLGMGQVSFSELITQ